MRAACRLIALALLASLASFAARADSVVVSNFPEVQAVRGTVQIDGSLKIEQPVEVTGHLDDTRFVAFEDRIVGPQVAGAMPRQMHFLGSLDATGYGSVVISVATFVPTGWSEHGKVGVLLVPAVAIVHEAADRDGSTPLALRFDVEVSNAGGTTAAASSERLPLAFPRWHAYLTNTSGASLEVHAFLMLGG